MAFNEVIKGEFMGREAAYNSVRAYTRKGTVKFSISKDIMDRLGNPMFFRVAVGTGQHSGLVALIPTRAKSPNAYCIHATNGTVSVTASKIGNLTAEKTIKIPHEITDDGLVVDVRPITVRVAAA